MKRVYVTDLNGELYCIRINNLGEITDSVAFRIIYQHSYIVTNGKVTKLLIGLIKNLLTSFFNNDMDSFVEGISDDGIPYFRFSNEANFAMTFVPFDNNNECYLLSIMPAIEL